MAPSEDGAMRKIPEDVRAEEGRALARLGDGGWDPLVQAGRRAGRFDDELVGRRGRGRARLGRARRVGDGGAVAAQRRAGARLRARGSRRRSGSRTRQALERTGDGPPQREMANSAQQVANVRGQFAVAGDAAGRPVPARRRPALQRLDARDARRAAAPPRRRRRSTRSRSPRAF